MNNLTPQQEPWKKFYKKSVDGRWFRRSRTGGYAVVKSRRVLKNLTVLAASCWKNTE